MEYFVSTQSHALFDKKNSDINFVATPPQKFPPHVKRTMGISNSPERGLGFRAGWNLFMASM